MIDKKKIKKGIKVWFDDELWTVVNIISSTKYDDYVLLSRSDDLQLHEDDKTSPVIMILLDAHNDEFYLNTPEVRKVMKSRKLLRGFDTSNEDIILRVAGWSSWSVDNF